MYTRRIILTTTAALMPLVSDASTPFAGTWTVQPQETVFAINSALGLSLENGTYKRTTCAVTDEVPADGADHPVNDDPFVDTMAVHVNGELSVAILQKARGALVWKGTYDIAPDRRTMTLAFEDRRPANPVAGRIQFDRVGEPLAGASAMSGTWQPTRMLELSPSGRTVTFQDTDHGLIMHASDGRSFQIEYGGGNNEPLLGYLQGARVHVGRREPYTLQVNRTQDGAMVELAFGRVSADGLKMKWSQMDWQCQAQTILLMVKQAPS